MIEQWQLHSIAELILKGKLFIGDGYRAKNEELSSRGLPFARVGNINGGFRFDEADHFPEKSLTRVGNKVSEPWDVVFTSKGTVGRFAIVRPDTPRFVYSPQLCFWRSLDKDAIDPSFLYYWMFGREFFLQFKGVAAQTDMAEYVSLTDQRRMHITLPRLNEQRAIAHILGTLDDKIELNRKMNQTLEAMARAIFKSWFVDFDPVRAKAEGRDMKLPTDLAALFPDSFEHSELGEIPKGWGIQRLSDVLSLEKGLSYKGQYLTDDGVPMVNLGCFIGNGRFAEQALKKYSGEYKGRHCVRPYDLVLANTDITQKREVLGSPAIIPPQGDLKEMIFTHHVFAARFGEKKEQWKFFVYFLLLQEDFRERAMGFATGTTVLALPRDAVLELEYPAVPLSIIDAFNSTVVPLIEYQWKNDEQSRTLAALRDALLPKLLSGEIRVKDPEKLAEAAL